VRRGLLHGCESETGPGGWENPWPHDPAGLAVSNDGTRIAVARRDDYRHPNRLSRNWDVQVFSAETGREIRALSFYPRRYYFTVALAFSPDGATLAAAPGDLYSQIRLWDLQTGEPRVPQQGHEGGIRNLVFSRDGERIATTDLKSVRVWDVGTGKQTNHILRSEQSEAMGLSRDDEVVVIGEDDQELMWCNLNNGTATRKPTAPLADIWRIAVSPDGNMVAVADEDEGFAILFDKGHPVEILEEHWGRVNGLAFSSDGETLVSGSDDRTVVVWDTKTFRPRRLLEGPTEGIQEVSVSGDGRFVAATARDNPSYVWDAATGELLHQVDGTHIVISPDGRIMAAGVSEGVARHQNRFAIALWDLASGKELLRLRGFDNWLGRLAFSPDGTILASAHGNHALLWDIAELGRQQP
jgi:WD40 repeat protein